jgi:hypothetical protein
MHCEKSKHLKRFPRRTGIEWNRFLCCFGCTHCFQMLNLLTSSFAFAFAKQRRQTTPAAEPSGYNASNWFENMYGCAATTI